ncbi:MAG: hypothetical protein KGM98_09170 [Bacteroidota bacterium]|nr:hypothetical protein [Bacteroidota bacterium]
MDRFSPNNRLAHTWLKPLLSAILVLCCLGLQAQNVNDYFLIPGSSFLLPEGESMHLYIHYFGPDGTMHEGVDSYNKQLPQWFLNGKPRNQSGPKSGKLSEDLSFEHATYTAPSQIPPGNPVTISVQFHPSDSSKTLVTLLCNVTIIQPAHNWYITFTYESTTESSDNSATQTEEYRSHKTGSASMVIRAESEDDDGQIRINTEDDSVLLSKTSGTWQEDRVHISRNMLGAVQDKDIRHHTGKVTTQKAGFEFEYDSDPNGERGLAGTGLDYDVQGTDRFFKMDNDNHLVETDEEVHEPYGTNILLGSSEDHLKKTRDGFQIDYSVSKDTTYTDAIGVTHHKSSHVTYHVSLTRKKASRRGTTWNFTGKVYGSKQS